jgi:hypothetical protein
MQPATASAEEAYARLAPFYDELTREHDYAAWIAHLEGGGTRAEVERAARAEGGLMLAPPYSIARRLIGEWLAAAR